MTRSKIEQETARIGQKLISDAQRRERGLIDAAWWEERVLEFCMAHPTLKVQLFRFIDVLPTLHPRDVTPHLLDYLGDARDDLPSLLRWSVQASAAHGAFGRVVSRAARQNVRRMARRFIAGSTTQEAIHAIHELRAQRLAVTIDVLGEAVITEKEADAYRDCYLDLLSSISRAFAGTVTDPLMDRDHDGRPLARANISLKLSALAAQFDPIDPLGSRRAIEQRFRAILNAAQQAGGFVYVDMESYDTKRLVLQIFKDILGEPEYAGFSDVGVVIQAYLKDSERDIAELAEWAKTRGAPIWVRLVKGAYWDYETVIARQRGWSVPVFEEKWRTDANFERCADLLIRHHDVLRLAVASHNIRSIARALAAARSSGLPERFIEFQTLYGMADPLKHALVELGQRVRVYTPYGELIPGMAYLVRRLLENTSNESFLRHQMVGDQSEDELLRAPSPPQAAQQLPPESPRTPALFQNEPLQDFSRPQVRERLERAFALVKAGPGVECPLVIDGMAIQTADRVLVHSPSDVSRVLGRCSLGTPLHADQAVSAALVGWDTWRGRSADDRAQVLERAATLLGSDRSNLTACIALEAAKPWRDADADVAEAIDFCRYYAVELRRLAEPRCHAVAGESNATHYVPRGVTVVISPWNFPLAILCGMASAALAAGNPVILKPAEQTPLIAYRLYQVLRQAGVPAGALHFVPGRGEVVGARLVEHPDVAVIAFTGSRQVGQQIAKRAAETSTGKYGLKRVIAEMGGKNAIIVDEDADLDEAVPGVLHSAFGYAGQKCSACSRVIVIGRGYQRFLSRIADAAESLVIGPAEDPGTDIGPLIDEEAVERVLRYAEIARREGRIVFQARLTDRHHAGRFVPPLIITDLPQQSTVLTQEVFGPLLAVIRVATLEAALEVANASDYALTGGLYSRSPRHIERVRDEFEVGNLYINRKITGAFVGRQPFGGFRHSGTGSKAGGPDYLPQFMAATTVTENTIRRGFAADAAQPATNAEKPSM